EDLTILDTQHSNIIGRTAIALLVEQIDLNGPSGRSVLDERFKIAGVLGVEVSGAPQSTCRIHGDVEEIVTTIGAAGRGLEAPLGSIPALHERDDLVTIDRSISGRPNPVRRDRRDGLQVIVGRREMWTADNRPRGAVPVEEERLDVKVGGQ